MTVLMIYTIPTDDDDEMSDNAVDVIGDGDGTGR